MLINHNPTKKIVIANVVDESVFYPYHTKQSIPSQKNCYVVLVHINKQSLRIDNEIMGYGAQQNSSGEFKFKVLVDTIIHEIETGKLVDGQRLPRKGK